MSDESCLNPAKLASLHRIGGEKFQREMIDLFLLHAPNCISTARTGWDAGDISDVGPEPRTGSVEFNCHKLKSSAGNVGAHRLCDLAAAIEIVASQEARDNDQKKRMREIVGTLLLLLEEAYALVKPQLEGLRKISNP